MNDAEREATDRLENKAEVLPCCGFATKPSLSIVGVRVCTRVTCPFPNGIILPVYEPEKEN